MGLLLSQPGGAAIVRIATAARDMVALSTQGIREVQHATPSHEYVGSTVHGVPRHARFAIVGIHSASNDPAQKIVFPEDTVFRRYVAEAQFIADCLHMSAWPMRQYAYSPAGRSIYADVRGTFFTTQDFLPEDVGAPESRLFVDFLLASGTTFVHLGDTDREGKPSHWCLMFPYTKEVAQIPIRVVRVGAVTTGPMKR